MADLSTLDPSSRSLRRAWLARAAVAVALLGALATRAEASAWLLALALAYALSMALLLWQSLAQPRGRGLAYVLQLNLMLEAVVFTAVLSVLGALQTALTGLYGLLVLIGGLLGGTSCAVLVASAAAASYAVALGALEPLYLPAGASSFVPVLRSSAALRDSLLGLALAGTMTIATAVFSDQLRERARRAESLYGGLFHATQEPVVVYQLPSAKILDVNPAALELAGRERDALLQSTASELLPAAEAELARFVQTEGLAPEAAGAAASLHHLLGSDGTERVLAAQPPVPVEPGSAALLVLRDISAGVRRAREAHQHALELARNVEERTRDLARAHREQEAANRKLRELQTQLVEAQNLRAMEGLARAIAHSVHNPLQALMGTIELELESRRDGNSALLQRMLAIAKRIQRVIDSTLHLVRRGALRLRQEKPGELLGVVEDEVRARAERQSVRIVTAIDRDLPEIHVDRVMVISALGSIAENALEAMPEGGQLQLAVAHEPAAHSVCFSVADTGPGIPEELARKVLEPFFTTKGGGTGLGLAIANGIIQGHQGHIRIERAPSGGALVQVRLKTDLPQPES